MVVIPNSVTTIERYAFNSHDTLVEITIGKNVNMDTYAFSVTHSVTIPGGPILFSEEPGFFVQTYQNNGRRAGTYTRPDAASNVWTRE
jgi:hypothetical protein